MNLSGYVAHVIIILIIIVIIRLFIRRSNMAKVTRRVTVTGCLILNAV